MADEVWGSNAGQTPWELPASFSIGYPQSGNVLINQHPTHVGGWWVQSLTEEIRNVIVYAGLIFDPTDTTQLLVAVQEILAPSIELREDNGFELRENNTLELRQ